MEDLTWEGSASYTHRDAEHKEQEEREYRRFCLELASKQGAYDKETGGYRDKCALEIIDDARDFFNFIYKK